MATTFATSTPGGKTARATDWGRYARVALATVVAAVLGNVVVYYLGGLVVAYDPRFLPLTGVSGAIIFTLAPAIVAVLLYAILLRFARRPARTFAIIAAVVFVVTLIPDFTYIPTVRRDGRADRDPRADARRRRRRDRRAPDDPRAPAGAIDGAGRGAHEGRPAPVVGPPVEPKRPGRDAQRRDRRHGCRHADGRQPAAQFPRKSGREHHHVAGWVHRRAERRP